MSRPQAHSTLAAGKIDHVTGAVLQRRLVEKRSSWGEVQIAKPGRLRLLLCRR